jgi:hypothetical protein
MHERVKPNSLTVNTKLFQIDLYIRFQEKSPYALRGNQ